MSEEARTVVIATNKLIDYINKDPSAPKLIWYLSHFLGEKETNLIGKMIMPVAQFDFSTLITDDYIVAQLNESNCFDFEYIPKNGDNLIVRQYHNKKEEFMSFIFKGAKWTSDYYNVFSGVVRKFNVGKMQLLDS